jgi:hypothetical protein
MVESQPSKLLVASSILVSRSIFFHLSCHFPHALTRVIS